MMDGQQVSLPVVMSLVSVVLAVVGFFVGRQTAAKMDGEQFGKLLSDTSYIKQTIERVEKAMDAENKEIWAAIEKEGEERRESFRRVYARIEDIEKQLYNGGKK